MTARNLGGHEVRPAGAEDLGAFRELIARSGVPVEPEIAEAITNGAVGGSLLEAAATCDASLLRAAARRVVEPNDILPLFTQVSLALVAVSDAGLVVGALQGIAPGNVAAEIVDQGRPLSTVASLATRAAKISAVGVRPEASRTGVATSLLQEACSIYFRAGLHLVYGYFRRNDPAFLEALYRRAGFMISEYPHTCSFPVAGHGMFEIGTTHDQKMFSVSRSAWSSIDDGAGRRQAGW